MVGLHTCQGKVLPNRVKFPNHSEFLQSFEDEHIFFAVLCSSQLPEGLTMGKIKKKGRASYMLAHYPVLILPTGASGQAKNFMYV